MVETRLGEFVTELTPSSGSVSLIRNSKLYPCRDGSYELHTASITFELPVEYSRARELAGRLFPTIGLDTITGDDEDSAFFHDKTKFVSTIILLKCWQLRIGSKLWWRKALACG